MSRGWASRASASWVTYGLGSESQNLPAFVVMYDTLGRGLPKGARPELGRRVPARRLPGDGAQRRRATPIDNLDAGRTADARRSSAQLDLLAQAQSPQSAAPGRGRAGGPHRDVRAGLPDADGRPRGARRRPASRRATQNAVRPRQPASATHFARQCLIARRLVERGVRFVQIYSGGMENERSWDGHNDIAGNHGEFAGETDQPIAGLLDRPEAPRPARLDAGDLGRRVRPAADRADGASRAATTTRTPSPPGWPAAASRAASHYGATDEIGYKAVGERVERQRPARDHPAPARPAHPRRGRGRSGSCGSFAAGARSAGSRERTPGRFKHRCL